MFSLFLLQNLSKVSVPIPRPLLFSPIPALSSLLLLILAQTLFLSPANCHSVVSPSPCYKSESDAMKVHPLPRKRNITIQYSDPTREPSSHKKLRRLPHIFSRVLELPFRSDADVAVEETQDCFKFVAETDGVGEVRAHTVEIHPGVTRIVIRTDGSLVGLSSLDELELDVWRFRLPESTRPELARAVYEDGELIVTVPKGAETEEDEQDGFDDGELRGGMGNDTLVLVQ